MLHKELMPPQPAELIIYVNGEFLPDSQAKISTLDHGLMYGDGCFDAWCGRNGFIFQLDGHLDRLYRVALDRPNDRGRRFRGGVRLGTSLQHRILPTGVTISRPSNLRK